MPEPLGRPLPAAFFDRPVLEVATDLLGRVVAHGAGDGQVAVRLTEVEAYAGEADPGSHAFRGRTPRTAVMYGRPGLTYVYLSYGMHWCMNLVCGPEGMASAVLLRAGAVVVGHPLARARRPGARSDRDLARGPARLTRALGVDGSCNGVDATSSEAALRVYAGGAGAPVSAVPEASVGAVPEARGVLSGPRVGVAGAGASTPWRFWLAGEPSVSPYRAATPRRRARGSTP